jgi:hypothetical protein
MSTSTIDYDAIAAKHGGTAQIDYDALATKHGGTAVQQSAPDFTANPSGQGTYAMWDTAGHKLQIPYGNVQSAAQQGFKFDTNPNQNGLTPSQQFLRDQAYDPNRTGGTSPGMISGMTPEQSQSRANAIEQNDSLPMQIVGGVAKGAGTIARPFLDVTGYAMGASPQDINQMLTPQTKTQANAKAATEGTALVAAAPVVAAAPLATAGGIVGGTLGAGAGQVIGNATNMSQQATNVLSDTLGAAAGTAGALGAPSLSNALNFTAQKASAGALLKSVAGDANKIPVELANAQDVALELMDWQKTTNLGPKINKFLNRITSKGPLTYEEARRFYQVLGKLTPADVQTLDPPVQRSLNSMVAGLRADIGNAADQVGRLADYEQGMGNFRDAAQHQEWADAAKELLLKEGAKAVAKGIGIGAGGTATYGLWKWLTGK